MENFLPLLWVVLGIAIFVFLNVKFKIHNLIGLLIAGLFIALCEGMQPDQIMTTVQNGLGSVFGSLCIIIIFGSIIGTIMNDTGASQKIADTVIEKCGPKLLPFGLMFMGTIFGIAMFYEVAFLLSVPLVLNIAKKAKIPYMYLIIPVVTGCTMGHSLFPPQPGPVALVSAFDADISQVYVYGIIVIIPSIVCSGWVLPRVIRSMKNIPNNSTLQAIEDKPKDKLPSFGVSILIPLTPMFLMIFCSILQNCFADNETVVQLTKFLGSSNMSMLLALVVCVILLIFARGGGIKEFSKSCSTGISGIVEIVIVISAGGIIKQVIIDTGVSNNIVDAVSMIPVSPFIIAWIITVAIRILTGQGAVAAITASGIVAPMVSQYSLNPALMVLCCACGSNTITLMYDGGFLLFQQTFGISMKDTFKTWGLLELVNSVVGLIMVLILSIFITG